MNTLQDIYDLNTEILEGRAIDPATFYILASLSKTQFEQRRHWRKLIRENTSNTSNTGDTYTTTFTLPTDFLMTLNGRKGLSLTSGNTVLQYVESEFSLKEQNKNVDNLFFIDHYNNTYALCGTVSMALTHHLFYIAKTPDFTAMTDTWIMPSSYWAYIAFDVAVMWQLGMDYDDVNARNGNANFTRAEQIYKIAVKWDEALARASLNV